MSTNELRRDYLLDRWVVIASHRKWRPTDFARVEEVKQPSTCPFCPGNEGATPPAVLVYLQRGGETVKERDGEVLRHKDWLVRSVPNLYPAFTSSWNGRSRIKREGLLRSMEAIGHHEVIVESPRHDEHMGVARISQLVYVLNACQDRLRDLYSNGYVKSISIFRNYGLTAGASLSHAHTQIIATPTIPYIVKEELKGSRSFWEENKRCVFCDILKGEAGSPRLIWENKGFLVFAPWASVNPFEFWIFPRRHQSTLLEATQREVEELAKTLRVCFGALRSLIGDPPYNLGYHMAPAIHYHWHIEVYPRLAIWAGFEKSTGMFINVVPPEEAASSLREAIHREEGNIES